MGGTELQPNYDLLALASQGSSRSVDPILASMLRELAEPPAAVDLLADLASGVQREAEVVRVRTGLHKALDMAVHGSLCAGFLIQVMRIEWERLGGSSDDPAPWREEWG